MNEEVNQDLLEEIANTLNEFYSNKDLGIALYKDGTVHAMTDKFLSIISNNKNEGLKNEFKLDNRDLNKLD